MTENWYGLAGPLIFGLLVAAFGFAAAYLEIRAIMAAPTYEPDRFRG